jgi:hypothetical protein
MDDSEPKPQHIIINEFDGQISEPRKEKVEQSESIFKLIDTNLAGGFSEAANKQ